MKNKGKKRNTTEEAGTKLTDEQLCAVTGGREQCDWNDSGLAAKTFTFIKANIEDGAK